MLRITNRLSLRHVLALVMSGLTVAVLALAVLFANLEVRRAAEFTANERLTRVVEQLANLVAFSAERRLELKREVGRHPVIMAALRGAPVGPDSLAAALAVLRAPSDSGLPVQILDGAGRVVFNDLGERPDPDLRDYEPLVPLDTAPAYGAFHRVRDEVLYYSTTPVVDGSRRRLGWVVQRRRIGDPRNASEIQRLIGSSSRVLFSYGTDSLWITLAGEAVPAPLRLPTYDSTLRFTSEDGEPFLVRAKEVAGTPWSVLVEMPESVVAASSATFMSRMLPIGLVLVLAAVGTAFALSRRLTGPLDEFAAAADGFASGDEDRRVTVRGGQELGRLASAFNTMADQISSSHRALRDQLEEAQALAEELESLNEQAELAKSRAQAADRAKSEFLATMSHEIRTPINAVLGFCELLELESTSEMARRDYVRRTRRAARQLAALVSDVLDLAKVDSGEIQIRTAMASLRDSAENVATLLADEIARKSVDVRMDIDPELDYMADAQRVEQILLNLLSNAVKFTPANGRIVMRGRRVDGHQPVPSDAPGRGIVQVDVEDTGIGIAVGDLDRIFEPFIQAQTGYTREYGGTGLGLSISRRLARLMDGDITAESEPGRGSRFTLLLPAADLTSNTPAVAS